MREHLGGGYARLDTKAFHLCPDLSAGQSLFVSGEKDLTGDDFLFSGVFLQLPAQLSRNQDGADLTLQADFGPPRLGGFHRDIPHLGNPNAGGADGFHQQGQPGLAHIVRSFQQPGVISLGQLPVRSAKQSALDAQIFHAARVSTQKLEKLVQSRQFGVDGFRAES